MNFKIRIGKVSDAESITNILLSIKGLHHLSDLEPDFIRDCIKRHLKICEEGPDHTVYVAETDNGDIVGYGSVHWMPSLLYTKPEGYVSELFVHDSARGFGAGKKIIDEILNEARMKDCSRLLVLNSRIRDSYKRRFYQKCGWYERKEMANFVKIIE